jgi:DNA-binding LacI/PurR family transcriptional regulator
MVAAAAKVHKATVSLALRNDHKLPEATRVRIQKIARQLGYSPNPLVSLLMSRVRRRDVAFRGTIAYLHTVPQGTPRLSQLIHRNFLAGAKARAEGLGYVLDQFYLGTDGMTGPRLARMLRARGIAGLVVEHTPSPLCPHRQLPFDTAPFASASLGVPLAAPRLHYVANDQYMRAVAAARELLALGYRRLGFVCSDGRFDSAMAHRCTAGFWAVQQYIPELDAIPVLRLRAGSGQRDLARWFRRHRPDAVLGTHSSVQEWLAAAGLEAPRDFGWVHLDWVPDFGPTAGIYGNSECTGAAAIEVVVSQLHRGESGPPANPMHHLVAGSWIPGESVRRVGVPLDLESSFFADLAGA